MCNASLHVYSLSVHPLTYTGLVTSVDNPGPVPVTRGVAQRHAPETDIVGGPVPDPQSVHEEGHVPGLHHA